MALKVLKPSLESDPSACQRFLREGQTLASIKHEHVVSVYQAAQDEETVFLAMEWLQGQTLEQWVARNGPPAISETIRLAREMAAGLEFIHRNGLIHRDLKPNNIWVEEPGDRVKLLDFGLVRSLDEDVRFTASGIIVGTPAFMSPEQARGDASTPAAIYLAWAECSIFFARARCPFRLSPRLACSHPLCWIIPCRSANSVRPCPGRLPR